MVPKEYLAVKLKKSNGDVIEQLGSLFEDKKKAKANADAEQND